MALKSYNVGHSSMIKTKRKLSHNDAVLIGMTFVVSDQGARCVSGSTDETVRVSVLQTMQ